MTIICSGSLAFDRIMSFPGRFADSFLAEKMGRASISYLMDEVRRVYGGTTGNIAYNLSLLGEKPLIAGCLGDDPDGGDYFRRLEGWGCQLAGLKIHPGLMTASCAVASDRDGNQFTFFHPGAMLSPSGFDPDSLPRPFDRTLAIISAGGPEEMKSLAAAYRRLGLRFILDAGQQIHAFNRDELGGLTEDAYIFICNEYEFDLYKKITGLDMEGIFQRGVQAVVVTRGAEGSELLASGRGSQRISPVPVRKLGANPTGAGDAYRAGLLKALLAGESLLTACRLGSTVASFRMEADDPQAHFFTLAEVQARHTAAYRETLNLAA